MIENKKPEALLLNLTYASPDRNISVIETPSSDDVVHANEEDFPINIGGKIEFIEIDYGDDNCEMRVI